MPVSGRINGVFYAPPLTAQPVFANKVITAGKP